jgi:hypothetical protein
VEIQVDYYYEFNELYPDRLSEEQFSMYVPSAKAYIDVITHNRAGKAAGYKADRVKMAVCAVVCEMAALDAAKGTDGARLTSVSNDGYSESYASMGADTETDALRSAAMRYLSGTGLVSFL